MFLLQIPCKDPRKLDLALEAVYKKDKRFRGGVILEEGQTNPLEKVKRLALRTVVVRTTVCSTSTTYVLYIPYLHITFTPLSS